MKHESRRDVKAPTIMERFMELITSTEFMVPAIFVFIAMSIGYSVYFLPPDPGSMRRYMPPPVAGRRIHMAKVIAVKGLVERLSGNELRWKRLSTRESLGETDQIRLSADAGLRLELPRGAIVRVFGKALVQFHDRSMVLRYGHALIENRNAKFEVAMAIPNCECWGKNVSFLLEQPQKGAPSITALKGLLQLQTGRRRHTLQAGQRVFSPRIGVLSPLEKLSDVTRKADLAPFASF